MRPHAALLLLLTAAPAQATTALLPQSDDAVDSAARKALTQAGIALQPRDMTRRVLDELASAGVQCDVADAACLVRLGIAAGVDDVVAPVLVEPRLLRATYASTAEGGAARTIYGELVDADAAGSVASVALRAVGREAPLTRVPVDVAVVPPGRAAVVVVDDARDAPVPVVDAKRLWIAPGRHRIAAHDADGHRLAHVDVDVPAAPTTATLTIAAAPEGGPSAALFVAGAGAAALATGALVAGMSEVALQSPLPVGTRDSVTALGLAALGIAAGGAIAAGAGALWWVLE